MWKAGQSTVACGNTNEMARGREGRNAHHTYLARVGETGRQGHAWESAAHWLVLSVALALRSPFVPCQTEARQQALLQGRFVRQCHRRAAHACLRQHPLPAVSELKVKQKQGCKMRTSELTVPSFEVVPRPRLNETMSEQRDTKRRRVDVSSHVNFASRFGFHVLQSTTTRSDEQTCCGE